MTVGYTLNYRRVTCVKDGVRLDAPSGRPTVAGLRRQRLKRDIRKILGRNQAPDASLF